MAIKLNGEYYFQEPFKDELFTSWIVRNALNFGVKPSSLMAKLTQNSDIWKADLDVYIPDGVVHKLTEITGITSETIHELSLYKSCSNFYSQSGKTKHVKWVMPLGIRTQNRHQRFGLQICPCCLAEDGKQPYYRKEWRLGFMTACPNHSVQLIDRCPKCHSNISLKKTYKDKGNPSFSSEDIAKCHCCGYDFRESNVCIASEEELTINAINLNQYRHGHGRVHGLSFQYSHLYFNGIRRLMALLICNKSTNEKLFLHFRNKLGLYHPFHPEMVMTHSEPEFMDIKFRRTGLLILNYLLQEWPKRLVEDFEEAKVTTHKTHSNGFDYSHWIIEPLTRLIYRGRYQLTKEECESIVDYFSRVQKKQLKPHQARAYIYKYFGRS